MSEYEPIFMKDFRRNQSYMEISDESSRLLTETEDEHVYWQTTLSVMPFIGHIVRRLQIGIYEDE